VQFLQVAVILLGQPQVDGAQAVTRPSEVDGW
jgi:hypothetical protein